jgi:hypothetical protein
LFEKFDSIRFVRKVFIAFVQKNWFDRFVRKVFIAFVSKSLIRLGLPKKFSSPLFEMTWSTGFQKIGLLAKYEKGFFDRLCSKRFHRLLVRKCFLDLVLRLIDFAPKGLYRLVLKKFTSPSFLSNKFDRLCSKIYI